MFKKNQNDSILILILLKVEMLRRSPPFWRLNCCEYRHFKWRIFDYHQNELIIIQFPKFLKYIQNIPILSNKFGLFFLFIRENFKKSLKIFLFKLMKQQVDKMFRHPNFDQFSSNLLIFAK